MANKISISATAGNMCLGKGQTENITAKESIIAYKIIVNTPHLLLTIRLLYDIIVSMEVHMDVLGIDDFFLDSLPRYYPEEYIQKKYRNYVKWVHKYFPNTVPMPFGEYLEVTHMRVL